MGQQVISALSETTAPAVATGQPPEGKSYKLKTSNVQRNHGQLQFRGPLEFCISNSLDKFPPGFKCGNISVPI